MEYAVNSLVNYFVRHEIISETDVDLYIYGVDLLLYTIISISTLLVLGALLGLIIPVAFWLISFSLLQGFGGGYHASTHFRCFTAMAIGEAGALLLWLLLPSAACIVIGVLSLIVIWFLCPVEHPNAPLSTVTKHKMKKTTRICASCLFILGGLMYAYSLSAGKMLFIVLFTSALSMGTSTCIRLVKAASH